MRRLSAFASVPSSPPRRQRCVRKRNLSAPAPPAGPPRQARDRGAAVAAVERELRRLSSDPGGGVRFVEGSRWVAVFEEESRLATTWHGRPLHPERAPAGAPRHPFPWRGVGYLRLRRYKWVKPGPGAPKEGTADLALKMKKVEFWPLDFSLFDGRLLARPRIWGATKPHQAAGGG